MQFESGIFADEWVENQSRFPWVEIKAGRRRRFNERQFHHRVLVFQKSFHGAAHPVIVELRNKQRDGGAKILRSSEGVDPGDRGIGILSHPAAGEFRNERGAVCEVEIRVGD